MPTISDKTVHSANILFRRSHERIHPSVSFGNGHCRQSYWNVSNASHKNNTFHAKIFISSPCLRILTTDTNHIKLNNICRQYCFYQHCYRPHINYCLSEMWHFSVFWLSVCSPIHLATKPVANFYHQTHFTLKYSTTPTVKNQVSTLIPIQLNSVQWKQCIFVSWIQWRLHFHWNWKPKHCHHEKQCPWKCF